MSFSAYLVTPSSSSALRTLSVVISRSHTHRMRTCQELPPSLHGWLLQYWAIAVPITSSLGPGYNRRPSTAIQPCSQCRTECTSPIAEQGKTQDIQQSIHSQNMVHMVLEAVQGNVHYNSLDAIHTLLMNVQYCSPVHTHQSPCYHKYQLHQTLTGSTHA